MVAALERIASARRALVQSVATRHGMSVLQVEIVRHLASVPTPVLGSELAVEFAVSAPTVSDAARALMGKGLVEQVAGPDRRTRAFVLTPAGAELARAIAESLAPFAEAAAEAGDEALVSALAVIRGLWRHGLLTVDRSCATCLHHEPGPGAGRCALMQVDLTPLTLRVDCPEHAA